MAVIFSVCDSVFDINCGRRSIVYLEWILLCKSDVLYKILSRCSNLQAFVTTDYCLYVIVLCQIRVSTLIGVHFEFLQPITSRYIFLMLLIINEHFHIKKRLGNFRALCKLMLAVMHLRINFNTHSIYQFGGYNINDAFSMLRGLYIQCTFNMGMGTHTVLIKTVSLL